MDTMVLMRNYVAKKPSFPVFRRKRDTQRAALVPSVDGLLAPTPRATLPPQNKRGLAGVVQVQVLVELEGAPATIPMKQGCVRPSFSRLSTVLTTVRKWACVC